jgi:hypothetical protein
MTNLQTATKFPQLLTFKITMKMLIFQVLSELTFFLSLNLRSRKKKST